MSCIRYGGLIQNHGDAYFKEQPCRLSVRLHNHRLTVTGRRYALSLFNNCSDLQTKKVGDRDHTSINKLDELMRNSLTEIVKNVKQAPLLIQIYADGDVKTKKALPEKDWKNVANVRSSALEGIILVEELRRNSGEEFEEDDGVRAFGVLIQGKIRGRDECKSTCYLLKTSSGDAGGLGHVCTHFCLMKVQSFHKDVFSQFNDCWLLK
ncbi:hypothetical protein R6Q57_001924 [Mikania cordata]